MNTFSATRFCILLFAFLFASAQLTAGNERKKNGKVKTTHANGTKASQGKVKNYQKNGSWKYWNEKGILVKQATYKSDVLSGPYTEYYSAKQKANEGNYVAGQKNGNWNEWYTDGKQRSQTSYTNGQYNGTQKFWFENSNLREESVYQNGILMSRKTWYYNGRKRKIETYSNGMREGEWREYDETSSDTLPAVIEHYSGDKLNGLVQRYKNGRMTEEANYLNGRLNGQLRRWDFNGNLGLEENYSSGQLNGESTYFENGIVLRKGNYLNGAKNGMFTENNRKGILLRNTWYTRGREDSVHSYHPNGKIAIRKTSISGITLTETYEEFNEGGIPMLSGNYLMSQKQGIWTSYYPNGKKKSETPYSRGKVTGTYRRWHANGKLLIEMECVNGQTTKEPKIWNEAGKPLKRGDKEYTALLESSLPGEVYDDPNRYNTRIRNSNQPPPIQEAIRDAMEERTTVMEMVDVAPEPPIIQEDQVLMFAEEMPQFPGGEAALQEYLQKSIVYPEIAKEQGLQGSVYVNFVVKKDGTISDVRIVKGVKGAPSLDNEAMRVIKSMPKWKPGRMNGQAVAVSMNLPVRFMLK
ncbi:MAG: TonB family protein [Bacteroidia bacterium]